MVSRSRDSRDVEKHSSSARPRHRRSRATGSPERADCELTPLRLGSLDIETGDNADLEHRANLCNGGHLRVRRKREIVGARSEQHPSCVRRYTALRRWSSCPPISAPITFVRLRSNCAVQADWTSTADVERHGSSIARREGKPSIRGVSCPKCDASAAIGCCAYLDEVWPTWTARPIPSRSPSIRCAADQELSIDRLRSADRSAMTCRTHRPNDISYRADRRCFFCSPG